MGQWLRAGQRGRAAPRPFCCQPRGHRTYNPDPNCPSRPAHFLLLGVDNAPPPLLPRGQGSTVSPVHVRQGPQNETLFGKRVFADKLAKVRSRWSRVGSKSNDRGPYKKRGSWTRTWGQGHMKMGRDWSDASTNQGHQGLPATPEGQEGPSSGAFRGSQPCHTSISDFWPPGQGGDAFLLLSAPLPC